MRRSTRVGAALVHREWPSGCRPTSSSAFWLPYRTCLLALLIIELVCLAPPFDTSADLVGSWQGTVLFTLQHGLRPALITTLVAVIFFGWATLSQELREAVLQPADGTSTLKWLMVHLALIVPLAIGSATKRPGRIGSPAVGAMWVLGWSVLGLAAVVTLGLSALPVSFWKTWFTRRRAQLGNAAAIGGAAYLIGYWSENLWTLLQRSTFELSVLLLKLTGLRVLTDPVQRTIATASFAIQIAPVCSGIEGIGLVVVFLGAYLWLYRTELRFPRALVLLPVGMFTIWLLNGVRIAALVLLGNLAPQAAVKGFHSVAGWLFFNAVVCGLVAITRHFQLFTSRSASYTVSE
jgi:exosortase E/protease (VPEID-CTERM system)